MDGTAQSFIMDLDVMTLSYSSFWQRNETPPPPPSESQFADQHTEHSLVSQLKIKHVIIQHAWLEVYLVIGSLSVINFLYFVL